MEKESSLLKWDYNVQSIISDNIATQDFVLNLSLLLKGTEEEKLLWTFKLYDTNADGFISREEMEDIAHSVGRFEHEIVHNTIVKVFDLMGRPDGESEQEMRSWVVSQRVEGVFEVKILICLLTHKSI